MYLWLYTGNERFCRTGGGRGMAARHRFSDDFQPADAELGQAASAPPVRLEVILIAALLAAALLNEPWPDADRHLSRLYPDNSGGAGRLRPVQAAARSPGCPGKLWGRLRSPHLNIGRPKQGPIDRRAMRLGHIARRSRNHDSAARAQQCPERAGGAASKRHAAVDPPARADNRQRQKAGRRRTGFAMVMASMSGLLSDSMQRCSHHVPNLASNKFTICSHRLVSVCFGAGPLPRPATQRDCMLWVAGRGSGPAPFPMANRKNVLDFRGRARLQAARPWRLRDG